MEMLDLRCVLNWLDFDGICISVRLLYLVLVSLCVCCRADGKTALERGDREMRMSERRSARVKIKKRSDTGTKVKEKSNDTKGADQEAEER